MIKLLAVHVDTASLVHISWFVCCLSKLHSKLAWVHAQLSLGHHATEVEFVVFRAGCHLTTMMSRWMAEWILARGARLLRRVAKRRCVAAPLFSMYLLGEGRWHRYLSCAVLSWADFWLFISWKLSLEEFCPMKGWNLINPNCTDVVDKLQTKAFLWEKIKRPL